MAAFDEAERRIAQALGGLSYCNPFLPERLALEREALGGTHVPMGESWHKHADDPVASANLPLLTAKAESLADTARERLAARGRDVDDGDLLLYESVVLYLLYSRYRAPMDQFLGS